MKIWAALLKSTNPGKGICLRIAEWTDKSRGQGLPRGFSVNVSPVGKTQTPPVVINVSGLTFLNFKPFY